MKEFDEEIVKNYKSLIREMMKHAEDNENVREFGEAVCMAASFWIAKACPKRLEAKMLRDMKEEIKEWRALVDQLPELN